MIALDSMQLVGWFFLFLAAIGVILWFLMGADR